MFFGLPDFDPLWTVKKGKCVMNFKYPEEDGLVEYEEDEDLSEERPPRGMQFTREEVMRMKKTHDWLYYKGGENN